MAKFETSNKKLFRKIRPESTLKERLEHLNTAKQIGYKTMTGNIVGLPKQSLEDIANDILLLKKLEPYAIEVSIFQPTKGSEFENEKAGDINLALNTIALTRLVCNAPLNLASSSLGKRYKEAFEAGANYISLHGLPEKMFKNYLIYGGEASRVKFDKKTILNTIQNNVRKGLNQEKTNNNRR